MTGVECKLIVYMEGARKRFLIPVYQRNYNWSNVHCKRLYDDLIKVIQAGRKSHFFGSIVSVYYSEGRKEEFNIIDGQQRLTTVSLLFLAMYNLIENKIIVPESDTLQQEIFEEYLVDKYQTKETRIKLKPVKNDQDAFEKLFSDKDGYIRGSNLTENYMYFYERIQELEITIDQLYDAICNLEIIDVTLTQEDNPQLVFECLNSTGLDLSEGDKIRNFILMGLSNEAQEVYYDQYWNKIEVCTKYDVSAFARDYLSIKQQATPPQKKIYANFREYVESHNDLQTKSLLADMLDYAKRYQVLLGAKTSNKALNACIERLNRLETTVTRPFFLEVLRLRDEERLNMEQVTEIFLLTEKFIFRRFICEIPPNSLNKVFLLLHRDIMRYDNTDENYVEKCKYALLSQKKGGKFPTDEEFASSFMERDVFLMNQKNKIYILERLENFGTAEDKDVYRHCDDETYSIEHIMPQALSPEWKKELGEDYQRIYDTWIHRIANLTLTAYNREYSNSPFETKKTTEKGFLNSGIRMNTYIAQKDKWTEEELLERGNHLTEQALKIWEFPATDYRPPEKQMDTCTLEDEEDLSGRHIAKFTFKGSEQPVGKWVEMYRQMLQILYEEDKTIITKLAVSDDDGLAIHFSVDPEAFSSPYEIGDGIYVWTHTSTQSKLSVLSRLFQLYDEDPAGLVFYLKDDSEMKDNEDES